MKFESIFLDRPDGVRLHMKRIYAQADGPAVFLLHGSIENGRIFYSENGKGYAPYLARAGYDVFIPDLRGRGKSTPPVQKGATYGQAEAIGEEIPAFLQEIQRLRGDVPVHLGAHSWGGVSLIAYLARTPLEMDYRSIVLFASKRRIMVRNWAYWWKIAFGWNFLGRISIKMQGFLDAKRMRFGADNISKATHAQTNAWIEAEEWKHWKDSFDYHAALQKTALPPTLYFAGAFDKVLGHSEDVKLLAKETGAHQSLTYMLLTDYGHIDMLTHREAVTKHFPIALSWMQQSEEK